MSITQGLILSRSGTQVTVEVGGEALPPIQLARHLHDPAAAAAGDACLIGEHLGARVVIGVLGTAAAPPPPPPDPDQDEDVTDKPPDVVTGSTPVRPVWTGSYRGGWRGDTADLYQGDWTGRGIQTGAAFYGPGIRAWDFIAGLTTLLRRIRGAGVSTAQRPTMALLAGDTRPGSTPTILATTPGPLLAPGDEHGWAWPTGWVEQVQDGTAGGLGITSGGSRTPYIGLTSSGGGMTTTVHWRDEQ